MSGDSPVSVAAPAREVPGRAAFLRAAGYRLHLTRAIEQAGRSLYLQGRVPGSFYDGRGQEATAVGVALAMGVTYLFEHRSLRFFLINAGYHAVAFTMMGAILGAWR